MRLTADPFSGRPPRGAVNSGFSGARKPHGPAFPLDLQLPLSRFESESGSLWGLLCPPLKPSPLELGKAFRSWRETAGLTQAAVAAKSGIGVSYISNVEQGKSNPTFTTSARLAEAIGVPYSNIYALAEFYSAELRSSGARQ